MQKVVRFLLRTVYWGYFAFNYDKSRLNNVPSSFEELVAADNDLKIVIQDPRTATPGLGLCCG